MRDAHLMPEDLEHLLKEEDEVRNRLILHHLAVCPDCYAVCGYLLDLYEAGEVDLDLCPIDIALGKSRRDAPELWEQLGRHSFERQKALIRDTKRFRSWGLCELLCAAAEREAPRDPAKAEDVAELAVAISLLLEEDEIAEAHWLYELRAYALAQLANARRVRADLRGAEEAFLQAEKWWQPAMADVGDVLGYAARYLALKASLRRDGRHMTEALVLLREALEADPRPELRIRILISRAKVLEELGRVEEAIEVLREAREEAPADADSRIRLCLAQNHLDYLSKTERYIEAQAMLPEVEAIVAECGSQAEKLRFRWTRARIAKGLGRTTEALAELEEVREGFARLELRYDAALLSLEFALMHAELGRTENVLPLVEEALMILRDLKVRQEALMAIQVLMHAVAENKVTAELISQALDHMRHGVEPAAT